MKLGKLVSLMDSTTTATAFHRSHALSSLSFLRQKIAIVESPSILWKFSNKIQQILNRQHCLKLWVACHSKRSDFTCNRGVEPFTPIWISSSGFQLRSWCPGLAYFKLLPSVKIERNTPLQECSSGATHLKLARLNCLLNTAISSVLKK